MLAPSTANGEAKVDVEFTIIYFFSCIIDFSQDMHSIDWNASLSRSEGDR